MIETERLCIRIPTLADAPAMQAIKEANWPEIQKWMSWATDDQYPLSASEKFITEFIQNDIKNGGAIMFAFHKDTGDLVMVGGLNATDEPKVCGTGYWGNIDYLGQGYATEMTQGVLKYAFESHGAEKIKISYFADNEKSHRVIEKCGFQFVETKPKAHTCCLDGTLMDEHVFEMTRQQWDRRCAP